MIDFYLIGHDYEFEIRNIFRIFDLNSKININFNLSEDEIDTINFDEKPAVLSRLFSRENIYYAKAELYIDGKFHSSKTICENDIKLEKQDERKLHKTLVKKTLYNLFSEFYEVSSEYGFLTGIRPNKILASAINNNMSREEANMILKNTYQVSSDKIDLMNKIYDVQKPYMCEEINSSNYNLYIHIPFCPTRCIYCSFVSYSKYDEKVLNNYVEKLCYEISLTMQMANSRGLKLNTIYFGGGTPSVLSIKNINDIFEVIRSNCNIENVNEISFEAGRPDTLDEEKLYCLKENLVSRISINPQTMNQETLKRVLRAHSIDDIIRKYELAKKVGFDSINMDMIIGLPDETVEDVKNTIIGIQALKPDNITVHALAYKRGSELLKKTDVLTKDTFNMEKMYNVTKDICISNGYLPYYMYRQKNIKGNLENIGYCLPNKECLYNIVIIEEVETILACGAGAASKIMMGGQRHERVQNYRDLSTYMSCVENNIIKKREVLNGQI